MEINISEVLKEEQKKYYDNFREQWVEVTQRVLKGLDNPPKNFKGGFRYGNSR